MSENHPLSPRPRPADTAKVLRPGKTTTTMPLPRRAGILLVDLDGQADFTVTPGDRRRDESAAVPTSERDRA
ncbi:hypothetical protein [Nocardia carnea]|uniref:hypothetical protein n=1 Tax=Nocardia carnea TaxID=37328 RepID=UPI0024585E59|nr:hypothetical protein [Nocardia carnea]